MKLDYKSFFFSIAGAFFLLSFAFYNGYPIVYSDTSTYIVSGFGLQPPADRPITYGIFIRLMSFNGASLWTVAFMQSWIISFLIFLTIKDFSGVKNPGKYFLFVIAFLSTLTVIPYVSGQVITDIFSSIGILCILHLALNDRLGKLNSILLFTIYFIANAMHMSHLLINVLLLISVLLIARFFFRDTIVLAYKNILILFALSFLGIVIMGSSLAKSKNVFFMGRMAENGILKEFLRENCPDKQFKLCDCIDSIPANTTDFLWDPQSPLYTKFEKWSDAQDEFGQIIRTTFLTPKYLFHHIRESVKGGFKQLIYFDAGDGNGAFVGETRLYGRIKRYFSSESKQYSQSRQNRGLLKPGNLVNINNAYRIVIITSILFLLCFMLLKKLREKISVQNKFIAILFLFAILVNAFVNASLVVVTDRFGAKLIWMIPFILFLVIPEILAGLISKKQ